MIQSDLTNSNSGGKAKGRRIGILVALGCLMAAIGYAGFALLNGQAPEPSERAERATLEAAIAHIDAESRGALSRAVSSPAPPPEASSGTAGRAAPDAVPERPAPQPPEGYSFAKVETEMAKSPMPVRGLEVPEGIDDGLDWLGAPDAIPSLAQQAAAAGRDWSFGWARAALDAGPEAAKAALEDLGLEVLGTSGRLLRAKLPGDPASLQAIAALPQVAGLGAVPKERKVPAGFVEEVLAAPAYERTPVFITLMTDDPQGRWRRRLEELGAVVGRFDPDIRAYAAHIDTAALEAVASQDFVLAVEPIGIVRVAHDTAVPAMGVDAVRRFAGSAGLFSGTATGASVPIAVMDTGLNLDHLDISTHRESVCGANFAYFERRANDADLWVDESGHGTHVTGTIIGNGYVEPRYAGMAPGVRHIRFAKVLGQGGSNHEIILRGMDYLARPSSCAETGRSSARVKPLIVNVSLGASALVWRGRSFGERKLDSQVWSHRQLYVVAQANADIHAFSDFAAAKNSLAVGAVHDSGDLASFSSHGPTADGRLAPQVVATGVGVYSAAGAGSQRDYVSADGTSMASPSVAGVAALLMDGLPAHRERPALTRARLMASAIKPDVWLDAPSRFPADNSKGPGSLQARYGLGKASARTSVLNRNQADGWVGGGGVAEVSEGEYAHQDIEVPANASRLDLVMTWDEPPTDTIGHAVLNDLDLWLDRGGDCGSAACGERSSVSRKDNVEWIILRNPAPGTYRAKILPRRIHGAAPRAALAWTVVRGPAAPPLRIQANKSNLDGAGPHDLSLTLTADGYVAAGTRLHFTCDAEGLSDCQGVRLSNFNRTREDGVANNSADVPWGTSVELGEIGVGESQKVSFRLAAAPAADEPAPVRLYITASAWNAEPAFTSIGMNGSSGEAAPAAAAHPANDGFAAAAVLAGRSGALALDLRLATAEPGEPPFSVGRPAGSLWHVWTAPADGLAQFGVQHAEADEGEDPSAVKVEVFRGDRIAGLETVASKLWGASFFADQGETYRIRVSHAGTGLPLTLHWLQGPRPANDDFSQAVTLTGAAGSAEGSNQGATLQLGEQFGSLAATTWHHWQAPTDGVWQFKADHDSARLLAFTGSAVAELRLVSGYPSRSISFPARAGETYRIAVAAEDAFAGGRRYRLSWREGSASDNNDDFANAEEISGASSTIGVWVGRTETVQPGEPVATGTRTRWWSWVAPEDGRYTWRLVDAFTELQVTAFVAPLASEGVDLENLQLAGTTGPAVTSTEFAFNAVAQRRYWFAVGYATGDLGAFLRSDANADLAWGAAPEHDALANAAALSGAAGALSGSNEFATAEPGERIGRGGHSSLWWTWEAPTAGWYRFWVGEGTSHILVAYRPGGDGFAGLDPISAMRTEWLDGGPPEVLFYAEPGVRYSVRLGSASDASGGEFRLQWREAEAPVWLRYAGRLNATQLDLDEPPPNWFVRDIRGLAFDEQGTTLYMSSNRGLRVLERDAATGALELVRVLRDGLEASRALVWDPQRTKLYVRECYSWHRFAPIGDNREELRSDPFATADAGSGSSYCSNAAFMDPDAKFLYSVSDNGIDVFAFEPSDALRHVQFLEVANLTQALMSNSGEYVYAAANDQDVLVLERSAATGELKQVSATSSHTRIDTFAASDDERFLFAFNEYADNGYADTQIFQLSGDPVRARRLETLGRLQAPYSVQHIGCSTSLIRNGRLAADVFCENWAFSIEYRPPAAGTGGRGELKFTDYLASWHPDRFNNHISAFFSRNRMTSSPDGKHAYVATGKNELLFFERVGNQVQMPLGNGPAPPGDDHGNTRSSATVVALPSETGGRIDPSTDVDYFRFEVSETREVTAGTPGNNNTWVTLEDSEGVELERNTVQDGANYRTRRRNLSAGTYYVRVDAYQSRTGAYTLRLTAEDADPEPPDGDDHGNDIASATNLALGGRQSGRIDPAGDKDYFRIQVAESGTLTVYTTSDMDTEGRLFDGSGRRLASDSDGGAGFNFRIEREVDAGAYYAEVTEWRDDDTGSYTIHAEFDASTDPDGDDACSVGLVLSPGDYCTVDIPNINVGTDRFRVTSSGSACYGGLCFSGESLNLNGFRASRISDTNDWRIDALP